MNQHDSEHVLKKKKKEHDSEHNYNYGCSV